MLSYKIIRINQDINTTTVLLKVGDKTLQQDIAIDDREAMIGEIKKHLAKLEDDLILSDAVKTKVGAVFTSIADLVDTEVEVTAKDVDDARKIVAASIAEVLVDG